MILPSHTITRSSFSKMLSAHHIVLFLWRSDSLAENVCPAHAILYRTSRTGFYPTALAIILLVRKLCDPYEGSVPLETA